LVVKNLRPATQIDPRQYLEETWGKLDKALDIIFTSDGAQTNGRIGGVNGGAPFSMEQLYRGVENGCKQGFAADLCGKLEEKSRKHVVRDFREPLGDGGQSEGGIQGVLRETLQAWKVWMGQVKIVKQICFYMDRSFLLQQGKPSLMEMATAMFRTNMFEAPELRDQIVEGACDLITNARGGVVEGMDTFREAVKMFHELGVYTNVFEPKFLDLSQTYIMAHAKSCAESKTLPEYVRDAVQLMDREMARCEQFDLDQTTRRDLLALLEDHLISNQKDMLIYSDSVADLLDLNAVEDLRSLYSLLARRRLAEKLVPAFGQWINETGTSIVFDEKEEDSMVVKLLTLKKQLDHIWRASFQRNTNLGHILRGQFDVFMNKTKKSEGTWNTDNSKPGEMIAKYVDMLLRGGAKVIPESLAPKSAKNVVEKEGEEEEEKDPDEEEVVNDQLDQVLDLFRFVHGKAVFEAFYKKDLARRLLMNRTASRDAESSMLQRLKTECGSGFTQNLEQMFKDIELGREEMSSYSSLLAERGEDPAVQLDVKVLQGAAWPTYPEIPVLIPMEIKTAIDKFEQHYKAKHSGRKLEWKHALAHCQLKASFPKGQKEVVVSSFQAIVLLQFNGKETDEKVSYDYLKTATGLPEAELKRTLQSLACARLRPLTKHPKGKDIKESDSFIFNSSFSHERYRVKINQVQLKETKQENKETHERVAADRQFETQAAIVRIMKSRKTIGHSELIAEVIKATTTRGVLQPADIKKNIDRYVTFCQDLPRNPC